MLLACRLNPAVSVHIMLYWKEVMEEKRKEVMKRTIHIYILLFNLNLPSVISDDYYQWLIGRRFIWCFRSHLIAVGLEQN